LKSNQKQLRNDPIIRLQIIIPDLTTEKQTVSKNEKEQNKPQRKEGEQKITKIREAV
jgi:hypothetical protein